MATTCRYHANHLITIRRIRKGEQLTVYYGPGYASIRKALNYRVDDEYLLDYCEKDTPPLLHHGKPPRTPFVNLNNLQHRHWQGTDHPAKNSKAPLYLPPQVEQYRLDPSDH